uniref:Uncharacterized protein n=1 Tax=Candidatus Kentrum sp. LPFa TaxID=2126335 RepID=A0A450W3J0_9GAMM|nr:MAG: hypothetical protein BECKLPF1236A_GA0070988_1005718 [Candidatus Kentron sp. LPFa]VFK36194.1 MAG: hypothetical protein BECKLPF1236C_GA0070990_105151 [Candidatus Kentron sp. LPFa]
MNNLFHFIVIKKLVFLVAILLLVSGCVVIQEKPSLIQAPLPHDVDGLTSLSSCKQLTLSGRMLSFPVSCLNMSVEAYTTSGLFQLIFNVRPFEGGPDFI